MKETARNPPDSETVTLRRESAGSGKSRIDPPDPTLTSTLSQPPSMALE